MKRAAQFITDAAALAALAVASYVLLTLAAAVFQPDALAQSRSAFYMESDNAQN